MIILAMELKKILAFKISMIRMMKRNLLNKLPTMISKAAKQIKNSIPIMKVETYLIDISLAFMTFS